MWQRGLSACGAAALWCGHEFDDHDDRAAARAPLALPNILTYARIVAVPIVVGCMFRQSILEGGLWLRWVALVIFIAAASPISSTAILPACWGQQSSLGRMLDPIADKLLVASCLLMLAAEETIHGWALLAAVVILCREILVSGLARISRRTARQRPGDPARQMEDDPAARRRRLPHRRRGRRRHRAGGHQNRHRALWLSALLTLYTGWDYLQAGLHHLTREDA